MPIRFAIVGPGKVGTALARLLTEAGYEFVGAVGRTLPSARDACEFAGAGEPATRPRDLTRRADLVLITTPDDAIRETCRRMADDGAFGAGSVVAHCSGALPSTVLDRARSAGAHIGSMHPMQSFATAEQAVNVLPASTWCVEGEPEAVPVLRDAIRVLGGHVVIIPTANKALYHAAGCVASNYLVALQNAALKLTEAAGIPRAEARRILVPLLIGTLYNFERVGIPDCLTGPVARGDLETVRRHLQAIRTALPDLVPLYKVMGRETLEVALAKGTLSGTRADELARLLAGE
jgi:predicted short-subunit dehydrogenase-like oxidoreductase (DUF2520 family)